MMARGTFGRRVSVILATLTAVMTGCARFTYRTDREAPVGASLARTTNGTPNGSENHAEGVRWGCELTAGGMQFSAVGTTLSEARNRVGANCAARFPESECKSVDCRATP